MKLHKMERADFAPVCPLEWAIKDVDPALDIAEGDPPPLLAACPGSGIAHTTQATAGRMSALRR